MRQTFPISRSSDLTPAYRQSSKHMQTYLSSVVQDDTQQRVVLHDHLAFLQTTFFDLTGQQKLLGNSQLFIRDVARALDDLASVKQGRRDGIKRISRSYKHDLRQVDSDIAEIAVMSKLQRAGTNETY